MMRMKIRRSLLPRLVWMVTRLAWMVTTHSPTPLTGLMVILVPCLNSSLEFIRVSGLRCEIRTPSLAFLLCGLTNTPVLLMLKCSKIEIASLPSCLSRICFQRGLSAALLLLSAALFLFLCSTACVFFGAAFLPHDIAHVWPTALLLISALCFTR